MHSCWLAALVLGFFPLRSASHVPFSNTGDYSPLSHDRDLWSLHEAPSPNATSHLIFDTANSLLQHWTNTRYINGHTIIPATIPTGTILYHGTYTNDIPINPEWVATDAEHARYFCMGRGTLDHNGGCWQLTIAVKRPLRILYFDGSSAAKLTDGPMDTQDILLWGQSRPDMVLNEEERICRLCDWGTKHGIHGFMRMQMDFEVMLCNFTKDVEVISFLNLETEIVIPPERLPDPSNVSLCDEINRPHPPPFPYPPWRGIPHDILIGMGFDTMEVGTWHNSYPGDTRIIPDLSRIVSFYDTRSFPSLVALRSGQGRWEHRVGGLSSEDVHTLNKRLDDVLSDDSEWERIVPVDWKAQLHVITNRYAERLETLRYIVTNITETQRAADRAYDQLRKLLSPYRLHTAVPHNSSPTKPDSESNHSWAIPVFKQCATAHTAYISKLPNLKPSEKMLLQAIKDVNKEICRVVVKLWAEGAEWGLVPRRVASRSKDDLRRLLDGWKAEVNGLMDWLDWSVWVKCPEPCGPEEMCYMPTWPYFHDLKKTPFPLHPVSEQAYLEPSDYPESAPWRKPRPRCVRKIPPYTDIFT